VLSAFVVGLLLTLLFGRDHAPGAQAAPAAGLTSPVTRSETYITLETVATGLTAPNWGTTAPGQPNRLFVTDQDGILWAIDITTGAKSVFLDISSRLVSLGIFGPNTFDERGLLGVAFHPNYASNGLLYTFTSEPVSGAADFSTMPPATTANAQSVVAEWQVPSPANPLSVVDPLSRRELLRIDKPQFNHNAGGLAFGPDGRIYISLGDGGGADDQDGQPFIGGPVVGHGPNGNGQNPATVLGKILRIDPQGNNSANGKYGIPADNPFVSTPGFAKEIYAWGFRNPFRFSFDTVSGAMYIGDVGQNNLEEVDIGVAGGNYGWRVKEGSQCFDPNGTDNGFAFGSSPCPGEPPGLIDPIAEYNHADGLAVIGGFVYRGGDVPALAGQYVFGDFSRDFGPTGRIFHLEGGVVKEFPVVGMAALNLAVMGFGQDANGEVYLLANSTATPFGDTGVVLRIAPPPPPGPPLAVGGITGLVVGSDGPDASASHGSGTANRLYAAIAGVLAISAAGYLTTRARRHKGD
jgi:glucose/arabinose dehydrogenase